MCEVVTEQIILQTLPPLNSVSPFLQHWFIGLNWMVVNVDLLNQ